ncbi:MAG: acyl-CoA thioesterase [Sphingomonadaceae bacterium]
MERPEAARWRLPLAASPEDIDQMGHVNNAVYVRWLQEAGVFHWYALATDAEKERYAWLIARHEIDYRRPCHLGEALAAETWVDRPRGARFDRLVRVLGPGGDVRAEARTTWVLLDRASMRPQRVPESIIARFFTGVQPD